MSQPAIVLRDEDRDRLFEILVAVHNDPALFFELILNVKLRRWQRRVCDLIKAQLEAGDRRVKALFRTCHGSGKTWLAAGLVLFVETTRPYSRTITLAQTWDGVENLIWPEIAALYRGSLLAPLGFGRMLTTKFDVEDTWYAIGASSDKPERLEGHHSKVAAMRVVDEAKAVDEATFDATEGMLDAPETFDLWISTPSIENGRFYDRDTGSDESVIRAVVDVDELIEDGVPGKAEWKADRLAEWGESDDRYQSRVMAQYVAAETGTLFPVAWIERAMKADFECGGPVVAGMDVAGSVDGDENAVAVVQGPDPSSEKLRVLSVEGWHELNTMVSKGRAISIARPYNEARLHVDEIGLGKGVRDQLAIEKYPSAGYRSTDKPRVPEDFANRKAEDAWKLRGYLEKGTIRLPESQQLKAQLKAMKYQVLASGKKKIIDPSDSPDLADAVIIAVANAGRAQFRSAVADTSLGDTAREWQRSSW